MSFVVGALTQWAPSFIIWASKVAYGVPNGYSQRTASVIFGAITVVTGIVGVVLGGEWAKRWGKTNPRADAFVCAIGLLASAPFLYFALLYAHRIPSVFWVRWTWRVGCLIGLYYYRAYCETLNTGSQNTNVKGDVTKSLGGNGFTILLRNYVGKSTCNRSCRDLLQ
jgi:hypothetical protein